MNKTKLSNFITRGNEIAEKDKQQRLNDAKRGRHDNSPISGREYAQWMSELKMFTERNLKGHPLYKTMNDAYFFRDSKDTAFDDMMGCLQILLEDEDYGEEQKMVATMKATTNISSLEQLLSQDIEKCRDYLQNPQEDIGRILYTQITARYDSVIKNFGNGLYSYIAEHHFYDPDVDISTINHNLTMLLEKMITYQAIHYGSNNTTTGGNTVMLSNKKVFIVHGHDNEAKIETARVIEKLGLQAIILHEQASGGGTIIEKIERYSDVGFAVVLYTPCDLGHSQKDTIPKSRARQNVVFEHGYLIGKLGRNRVCALVKGDIETPGDISGVVYVPMDSAGAWKYTLVDEMNDVGFTLDKNDIR